LPASGDAPASFTTPAAALTDTTVADFAAGSGPCMIDNQLGDGEVSLAPALNDDFNGTSLSSSAWSVHQWGSGSASASGGSLTVDGVAVFSNTSYSAGSALDFVATFPAATPFVHVGFAGSNPPFNDAPWALFSTGTSGTALQTRVWLVGGSFLDYTIPGSYLGAPHHYRIEWTASAINFLIDGILVHSEPALISGTMAVGASKYNTGGANLTVDWLRVSPYTSPCVFLSRVLDAGGTATWSNASWNADLPASTGLTIEVRTGNSPTPDDGTWSAFASLSNGASVGATGRYLQYRATLSTTDPSQTPVLRDISFAYSSTADTTPPVITALAATAHNDGTATVSWTTDEPADSQVAYGTSSGSLLSGSGSSSLVTNHSVTLTGLSPTTTYYYRVSSTDASANAATLPLIADPPASFATPSATLTDTTVADFSAGSGTNTYVSKTADGEVILAPTVGAEFSGGPGLPTGWSSTPWTGGTSTVGAGVLTVDGALAATNAYYDSGRAIEFVATFGGASFEHVGFGQLLQSTAESWAMFSTFNTTNSLYARTDNNGTMTDTLIPGSFIGSAHRYRIEWTTSAVSYYVDGSLVHTDSVSIGATLRPIVSDYDNLGPVVTVDWLRMTPYATPATFLSRVFDGGEPVSWIGLSWTADLPAGTTLTMSARTGNTPTPDDGSWSAFRPVSSSGDPVGAASRYVQYEATLSTSDPDQTPTLRDVTLTYGVPVLDHLVLSPASSTIASGYSQAYTAEGFDVHGNSLGDVTGSTTFTISGSGSCTLASCTTNAAVDHTVTGTDGAASGTATLTVTPGTATQIAIDAGNGQSATVGTAVSTAPSVIVKDQYGNPVAGVSVTFAVGTGGGSLTAGSATTNASGIAAVGSWTLGTTAGSNTLTATSTGLTGSPLTFTATGSVGTASKLAITTSAQTTTAGVTSGTITVQIQDQYGNAVNQTGSARTVNLTTSSTGGVFRDTGDTTTITSVTIPVGSNSASFKYKDTVAGTPTITAATTSPTTLTSATQSETTLAGTATQIAIDAGNGQSATVGTSVSIAPSVIVKDQYGNPVAGVSVTFAVGTGGGSLTAGSATTNASGIAAVGSWTLGTTAGSNTLTATSTGLTGSPLTFTATGSVGTATQYLVSSSSYSPIAGGAVTISAQLADTYGNSVSTSGLVVTWSESGSGGSFATGTSTTNASGLATVSFTAGTAAGTAYTVTGTDTSSRTGTSSPITTLAGVLDHLVLSPSTATVNPGVGQTYTAEGFDAHGNDLFDVTPATTFTIAGGTCTGTSCTSTIAGDHTVTGTDGTAHGTATLTITGVQGVVTGATYVALTPNRILDTRSGNGLSGPFTNHAARTFGVSGRGGVPANATAVTGNLTVTGQTSSGYLFIGPVATNDPTSSTLNFPVSDDRANGVTVALGAGGTLSITFVAPASGPIAHVIFDVTGYFTPDSSGSTYLALNPARILDTRSGTGLAGPFSNHVARTFGVSGHGGVPANATAVTGNLTVTGQTSSGYLFIGPAATDDPTSSTLNFPVADDRANGVTVALGAGGTLSVTFVAPAPGPIAHVIFDVTGYFVPGTSGATYVPLNPSRILDTRSGTGLSGPFSNHAARTFGVSGIGVIPSNATAVTGNLTVTGQTSNGYLFVGPVATNDPTSSTLNFPVADDRANGVTVALGAGGTLSVTYVSDPGATTHVIFDVTGYFTH
jgi:hypothetical protein